jgi:hypothetical protein
MKSLPNPPVLTCPLDKETARPLMDEEGWINVIIEVSLDDLISFNMDELMMHFEEKIVEDAILSQIDFVIETHTRKSVFFNVVGELIFQ